MDKQQFLDWHVREYNPELTYVPKDLAAWYDLFEKRHSDLITTTFGGKDTVLVKPKVVVGQAQLPTSVLDEVYGELLRLIPSYFGTYGFSRSTLVLPSIPSDVAKFGGMSVTKHIGGYVKRLGSKISEENSKGVAAILSRLAKWYREFCIEQTEEQRIILSCNPAAILNIGRYDCDSCSCFKAGGMNRDKTYAFGVKTGSFVALAPHKSTTFGDTISTTDILKMRAVSRALCLKVDDKLFLICNRNGPEGANTTASHAIRHLLGETAPWTLEIKSNTIKWAGGINYHGEVIATYPAHTKPEIPKTIVFSHKYSEERWNGDNSKDYYANYDISEPSD